MRPHRACPRCLAGSALVGSFLPEPCKQNRHWRQKRFTALRCVACDWRSGAGTSPPRELCGREKLPLKKRPSTLTSRATRDPHQQKNEPHASRRPTTPPALSIPRRLYTPTPLSPSLRVDTKLYTIFAHSIHHSSFSRGISTSNPEISTVDLRPPFGPLGPLWSRLRPRPSP